MSAHRCGRGVGMLSAPGAHDWCGGIKAGQWRRMRVLSQRGGGMAAKEGDHGELRGCGVLFSQMTLSSFAIFIPALIGVISKERWHAHDQSSAPRAWHCVEEVAAV